MIFLKNYCTWNIQKIVLSVIFISLLATVTACVNPFAPARVFSDEESQLLSDQKTTDGFFRNFQYAYNFKDTIVYSKLLADDFSFVYTNYDAGVVSSWMRFEDMLTTYRLFLAARNLNLIWNDILADEGDDLQRNISRNFNLTITFSSTDIVQLYGKANFNLKRSDTSAIWQLALWQDGSVY